MPWISAQKVYTEDELVRAFLRAGQFVHADESLIRKSLAQVHDVGLRKRLSNRKENSSGADLLFWAIERCASKDMLAISAKRGLPRLYMGHGAVELVARDVGLFCCICFGNSFRYNVVPDRVCRFFCPTALGVVVRSDRSKETQYYWSRDHVDFPSSICRDCEQTITRTKEYRDTIKSGGHEAIIEAYIAGLSKAVSKSGTFKQHLESVSRYRRGYKRVQEIRFDPRYLTHVRPHAA